MGIDFTTHPKGKFHAIDKTRHGIKAKLEHLMNSTKEQFTIKTINISHNVFQSVVPSFRYDSSGSVKVNYEKRHLK